MNTEDRSMAVYELVLDDWSQEIRKEFDNRDDAFIAARRYASQGKRVNRPTYASISIYTETGQRIYHCEND